MRTKEEIKQYFTPEVLNRYEKVISIFFEKNFSIKDLKLSNRVIAHWYKVGILGDGKEIREIRKFSILDYCWLQIIKEMREFNINLSVIKEMKDELFSIVDLNVLKSITPDSFEVAIEITDSEREFLEKLEDDSEEIQDILKDATYTYLSGLIISSIALRDSLSIMINSKGEYLPFIHKDMDENLKNPIFFEFFTSSHISISINSIIADLVVAVDNMNFKKQMDKKNMLKGALMSNEEIKVLELIKTKKISEVNIFGENDILIKKIKINEDNSENIIDFVKSIFCKMYKEIIVTTKNGKEVHLKKK